MFDGPCRLPIPQEGRDKLLDQIESWAKAKGRTTDVHIDDDLIVTVDDDPGLCDALKEYFGSPAAWAGGLRDFLDFPEKIDNLLSEVPEPDDPEDD